MSAKRRLKEIATGRPGDYSVTAADELFVNLDGSILQDEETQWRVEVCGIHSTGSRYWIQLNLCADDQYGVTVATDRLDAENIRAIVLESLRSSSHATVGARVVSAAHA